MDAAALDLLDQYRRRVATWQAAYERMAAENLRLRVELDRLLNRPGTGQCGDS